MKIGRETLLLVEKLLSKSENELIAILHNMLARNESEKLVSVVELAIELKKKLWQEATKTDAE